MLVTLTWGDGINLTIEMPTHMTAEDFINRVSILETLLHPDHRSQYSQPKQKKEQTIDFSDDDQELIDHFKKYEKKIHHEMDKAQALDPEDRLQRLEHQSERIQAFLDFLSKRSG